MGRKKPVWTKEFGISHAVTPTGRDSETSQVKSIACKFCIHFGRQEFDPNSQKRRKRSQKTQTWGEGWRKDVIAIHHKEMHGKRWEHYSNLNKEGKEAYLVLK